jgi:hypothetical protein
MQKHYIIGDIHAAYKTLLALVDKLPKDARLVFVGDLLSRGSQGKEVIAFVRENAFCCIRGNHEEYFLKFGSLFLEGVKNQKENSSPIWACKSISSTLRSYGLLEKESTRITLILCGDERGCFCEVERIKYAKPNNNHSCYGSISNHRAVTKEKKDRYDG